MEDLPRAFGIQLVCDALLISLSSEDHLREKTHTLNMTILLQPLIICVITHIALCFACYGATLQTLACCAVLLTRVIPLL